MSSRDNDFDEVDNMSGDENKLTQDPQPSSRPTNTRLDESIDAIGDSSDSNDQEQDEQPEASMLEDEEEDEEEGEEEERDWFEDLLSPLGNNSDSDEEDVAPQNVADIFADFDSVSPAAADSEEEQQRVEEQQPTSSWSDSSGDSEADSEEEWNVDEVLKALRESNEALKAANELKAQEAASKAAEEAAQQTSDSGSQVIHNDTTEVNDNVEQQEPEEEPPAPVRKYRIDGSKTYTWYAHKHKKGALLPFGAVNAPGGELELYKNDAAWYHSGVPDLNRRTSQNPRSYGNPSLYHEEGCLERARFYRDAALGERNRAVEKLEDAKNDFKILRGEFEAVNDQLKEKTKEAMKSNQLAQQWKTHFDETAAKWEDAFEKQQPLANAERERQAMIAAGIENSRDIETQTSPIQIPVPQIAEKFQSTSTTTQTDTDDLVDDEFFDLAKERDELLRDNHKLSEKNEELFAKAERLTTLLQDVKEWTEERDWALKSDSKEPEEHAAEDERPNTEEERHVDDPASPSVGATMIASTLFSPRAENTSYQLAFPSDAAMLGWPESWTDREQETRRSASWMQSRDRVAAELDSWEMQFRAVLNTSAGAVVLV